MSKHRNGRPTRSSGDNRERKAIGRSACALQSTDTATGDVAAARHVLARLLDTADLARVVPHLTPGALHHFIRHCGLEACGALLASATPAQMTTLFDLDLWSPPAAGRDDRFDADRFGEWLEVLVDTDPAAAARIVAAMDPALATAGLSRFVRVFDPATFEPTFATDDERLEPEVHSGTAECTVGGYLVRATGVDAWDAIVTLLMVLEADHAEAFHTIMRGCRRLSNSTPEIDGLDSLLGTPEQVMYDLARDREHRRAGLGYHSSGDARAFLDMARRRQSVPDVVPSINPLVAAYFRAANNEATAGAEDTPALSAGQLEPSSASPADVADIVADVLIAASTSGHRPRALLDAPDGRPPRLSHIHALMAEAYEHDASMYAHRTRELAFLANTLAAGCSIQDRAFTPEEASDAAVSICNLGLEQWSLREAGSVRDRDLVTAFELGWSTLHTEVCVFAAERLVRTLKTLRAVDAEIQLDLRELRVELAQQLRDGTPWRARKALDVIQVLDTPVWAVLLGLIDACPVLPAALSATLGRHSHAFSATAFHFISTIGHIAEVHEFVDRLPELLAG